MARAILRFHLGGARTHFAALSAAFRRCADAQREDLADFRCQRRWRRAGRLPAARATAEYKQLLRSWRTVLAPQARGR